MSLINDALKKAQRDRETAGKEESSAPPAHTPVAHAGPRPGNPAASRSFRWMRTIIAGTLVLSGIAAALLFMRTLISPEPAPEAEPPREVAVHIKLGRPDASTLPDSSPDAASADTISPTSAPTDPTGETPASAATSNSASTPAAAPVPTDEPAIAFKLTDDTAPETSASPPPATQASSAPTAAQTAPVADAQPSTAPVSPTAPANSPAPSPAVPMVDSATVATTPPASSPAATPPAPATSPAQKEPATASATGSAAAVADPEGPTAIAFAMPKQPVTVAGGENVADDIAPSQAGADPAIIAFLERSHIGGVKVAGKQSRVLMNNQVFFIGSVVDPQSRLRIKAITNSEIEFVDESGLEYRKRFQR